VFKSRNVLAATTNTQGSKKYILVECHLYFIICNVLHKMQQCLIMLHTHYCKCAIYETKKKDFTDSYFLLLN